MVQAILWHLEQVHVTAAVAHKLGMTNNKVIVHMPGGDLQVEVEDDGTVFMTGDVFYVAKITLSSEFTENLRSL